MRATSGVRPLRKRVAAGQHRGRTSSKIGSVELGNVARIVLAVAQEDSTSLAHAASHGVDILEIRIDQLPRHDKGSVVSEIKALRRLGLPIIATVRSIAEGGTVSLSDDVRAALYEAVIPLVDAIDIELESATALSRPRRRAATKGLTTILSYHDFKTTPSNERLQEIVSQARAHNADIVKIACMPKSRADVFRLLSFTTTNRHHNL